MRDPLDLLLTDDRPLAPDERAALDQAFAADPALAATARHLGAVRRHLRDRLDARLPDRDVLVLHALADVPGALSLDEHARLTAADVPGALAEHPGLAAVADRAAADRDAFEAAWAEAFDEAPAAPVQLRTPSRADRPARDRSAASRSSTGRNTSPVRWVWRMAALTTVVAFAAVLVHLQTRDAGWATITADAARTVQLPDGSTAFLAAGSRLQVPGAGADLRQARLRHGQALFRVVHDPSAPFTVETPNAEITVLGTTFAVDAQQTGALATTHVVLVEGAVTLAPRAAPEAAVRLAPGETSRIRNLDEPAAPTPADVAAALAWTGDVTARDEPARSVAARIGERFGALLEVAPALAGERVSGTFSGSAAESADLLARAIGATVRRLPAVGGRDAFRIEPAGGR